MKIFANVRRNKTVAIFFFYAVVVTITLLASTTICYDTIWCFHLSQKVANGYTMYSEISTVVAPIFFWIGGAFIRFFGNSLVSIAIYSGVIMGGIAATSYNIMKEIRKKDNDVVDIFFFLAEMILVIALRITSYNTLAILWLLLAVYFEIRREKTGKERYNYLTGIMLALALFTKQNIGAFGVISTGIISLVVNLYYKKKNPVKEILQKATGFLGVTLAIIAYFVLAGALTHLIDFCVLGITEFAQKNAATEGKEIIIASEIAILVMGSFYLIDNKKNGKVEMLITLTYAILMLGITYPVANLYHIYCVLFFIILFLIQFGEEILKTENAYKNYYAILIVLMLMLFLYGMMGTGKIDQFNIQKLFCDEGGYASIHGFYIVLWKVVSCLILYFALLSKNKNVPKYAFIVCMILILIINSTFYIAMVNMQVVPEGLEIYAYQAHTKRQMEYIKNVIDYIKEKEQEGYNVYVVSADASYYMAPLGRNNYKFDFMLYGSLGSKGEDGVIEDIKKLENELLLKDEYGMYQDPKKVDEYIKENYEAIDMVESLIVYKPR